MSELVLGKCRYCGSDVFYDSGKTYTKCSVCGQTLVIAEFQNEQIKLKRIEEERDRLEKDLEAAEKAIEAEQEKVWKVISEMDGLKGSLKEQEAQLNKLLKESQLDQETQKSILSLLRTMKSDQQQGQNSILSVINQIVSEQDTAAQKLSALQAVSAQLTDQNSDILNSVNQIAAWLHSESKQKNQIISNLFTWLNTHSEQDQAQLKQINAVSSSILAKQDMIGGKVDDLRNKVAENQRAIQSFQGKWEQSLRDQLVAQYRRAEDLQLDMAFDKAEDEYGKVVVMGGKDPEVYWRIILCHYGVVYQKDNDGNLIPTILSPDLSSQLSIVKNLENSYRSEEDRQYYSTRLKQISKLLDKYRRCKLDYQYDVFISVKQKRQINGEETYTKDYKIGADLFDHLTKKGLRVFNSEQPSCQKPGEEWEPYILAALLSSKVMIVVGTSTEYMESQWVQNEWRRFQWLQKEEEKKNGKTERKLLCFIDHMTGYDLPKDLVPLQAIINEGGAYQELDKVLKDCFPSHTPAPEPVPPISASASVELIRQKMNGFLAFKHYDLVKQEYTKVLHDGIYSLDAQINLYSICADHNLSSLSMLETASFDLSQEEKIQVILKNSKNPNDLKMLRKLLYQNAKNLKKNQQLTSVPSSNDNPVPTPGFSKVHINLSAVSAFVIGLMIIALKWKIAHSDSLVLFITIIVIGTTANLYLSFLLFRETYRNGFSKSIKNSPQTTLLSETAHLIICIVAISDLLFGHYYGRFFSFPIMPWLLLSILSISAISAIVTIVCNTIIRRRELKNGTYDYFDCSKAYSAVSAFVIGFMMLVLSWITSQSDLSILWRIVILMGTVTILYLSFQLFSTMYWNRFPIRIEKGSHTALLSEAAHLVICIVSIYCLFTTPSVWGLYRYAYFSYSLTPLILFAVLSISAVIAVVTIAYNIIIRRRARMNGIYDYPDYLDEKKEFRRNISYAIISLFLALAIFLIMLALLRVAGHDDWGICALIGITVIIFLSVLLFFRIYQLKISGIIIVNIKTRLIGVFHLCACGFGCFSCETFTYYHNIFQSLVILLLGSMIISAVGALMTIIQKSKR